MKKIGGMLTCPSCHKKTVEVRQERREDKTLTFYCHNCYLEVRFSEWGLSHATQFERYKGLRPNED